MIERFDPFGRMLSLRQMMDRLMEDAMVLPREGDGSSMGSAGINVYEEGENLVVEAHLPGLRPDEVQVTVEGGMLTIRGEHKAEEERKERNYIIREHRHGSFVRTVRLPDTVDTEHAQANFENGVLRLTLPRSEQAKPRRIAIQGQTQQSSLGSGQPGTGRDQSREAAAAGTGGGTQGATTGTPMAGNQGGQERGGTGRAA